MNPLLKKILAATRLGGGSNLADAVRSIQDAIASPAPVNRGAAPSRPGGDSPPVRAPTKAKGAAPAPGATAPAHLDRPSDRRDAAPPDGAAFASNIYVGPGGTRTYRLFRPGGLVGRVPLVVMLHGCKQDPTDFAVGTRMNELAQELGFIVAYPEQAARSNASKCWNWFVPADQHRGRGEPELLAGIARRVIEAEPIDADRVYVAGLSAGGSMAAILGREYPDVFAAVGVHSGLPPGAAHDVSSAFAAMQHGSPDVVLPAPADAARAGAPTIVSHGDRDRTVHPGNAERLVDALLGPASSRAGIESRSEAGSAGTGARRRFTRTVYREPGAAHSRVERWVVHGAGHAWAGGSPDGSFTDPRGPDASREFLRFFDEHRLVHPA